MCPAVIVLVVSVLFSKMCFGDYNAAIAVIAGLVVGLIIGIVTEVYTSGDYKSVKEIAEQSETGAATTIISGIAVGMKSTAVPIILICRVSSQPSGSAVFTESPWQR